MLLKYEHVEVLRSANQMALILHVWSWRGSEYTVPTVHSMTPTNVVISAMLGIDIFDGGRRSYLD